MTIDAQLATLDDLLDLLDERPMRYVVVAIEDTTTPEHAAVFAKHPDLSLEQAQAMLAMAWRFVVEAQLEGVEGDRF